MKVPYQHGLVKNGSATSNVVNLVHKTQIIVDNLDNNMQSHVIYMDSSKAFYRINRILIGELYNLGISEFLIKLFLYYLSVRNEYVCIKRLEFTILQLWAHFSKIFMKDIAVVFDIGCLLYVLT